MTASDLQGQSPNVSLPLSTRLDHSPPLDLTFSPFNTPPKKSRSRSSTPSPIDLPIANYVHPFKAALEGEGLSQSPPEHSIPIEVVNASSEQIVKSDGIIAQAVDEKGKTRATSDPKAFTSKVSHISMPKMAKKRRHPDKISPPSDTVSDSNAVTFVDVEKGMMEKEKDVGSDCVEEKSDFHPVIRTRRRSTTSQSITTVPSYSSTSPISVNRISSSTEGKEKEDELKLDSTTSSSRRESLSLPLSTNSLLNTISSPETSLSTSRFNVPLVPARLQTFTENRLNQQNVTIWRAVCSDKLTHHEIKLASGKTEAYRVTHLVSRSYLLHTHLLALEKSEKLKIHRPSLRISVSVCDVRGEKFFEKEEEVVCKNSVVASLISFEVSPQQVSLREKEKI